MAEIPVVYTPESLKHNPQFEIFNGQRTPHAEVVARVENILEALGACDFVTMETPTIDPMPWVERVHDAGYLDYLKRTSDAVDATVKDEDIQAGDVKAIYPSVFPLANGRRTSNPVAQRGTYVFDTYTPIMQGTYEVAKASASVAVAGAEKVMQGAPHVYALTRPPGHHAETARAGGYCYFNNAAVAAEYMLDHGAKRVAIFDFDIHHGNGTQDIFYDRDDVYFVSTHADPERLFPFFRGGADEIGVGDGRNYNFNIPLPEGTGNDEFHGSVETVLARIKEYKPDYLILSAGFDTHEQDPIGVFKLTTDYYQQLGRSIAELGIPTLSLQEGGYATEVLGANVVSYLSGFLPQNP